VDAAQKREKGDRPEVSDRADRGNSGYSRGGGAEGEEKTQPYHSWSLLGDGRGQRLQAESSHHCTGCHDCKNKMPRVRGGEGQVNDLTSEDGRCFQSRTKMLPHEGGARGGV
jgi:hypothetical protein